MGFEVGASKTCSCDRASFVVLAFRVHVEFSLERVVLLFVLGRLVSALDHGDEVDH